MQLQKEVNFLSGQVWKPHYQKLHYEGDWTAIPLRSFEGKPDNIYVAQDENQVFADTDFLKQSPYLQKVVSTFQCPLKTVRLLKLGAGAVIKEHMDMELYFEKGEVRIHIPVFTNDAVEFFLDNERMHLKEGECWYMNFNLPHRVENKSAVDRIHLVIDAVVNDWVNMIFEGPGIIHKKTFDYQPYDEAAQKQIIHRLREMNTETSNRLADEMENGVKGN